MRATPLAKRCGARLDDLEFGDRGFAHPVDFGEPRRFGGDRLGERAETLDQRLGERLDVAPRDGAKQHQLDQLVIGDGLGAGLQQALAQARAMSVVMGIRLAGRLAAHRA